MLTAGFSALKTVKAKSFQFDGYKIKAQFNPGRITSTSAKVDAKSISERKCFYAVKIFLKNKKEFYTMIII